MSNKDKAKWLSEFYQQVADGGEMQILYESRRSKAESGPNLDDYPEYWRVVMPPKLVPVDMSALVGSGINCEFWDLKGVYVGQLVGITDAPEYRYRSLDDFWARCQPPGYWFSAMNSKDVNALIIKLRNAGFDVERTHIGGPTVEFRITGLADDRCWPWEQGE
jgi:hypothetical protein